MAGSGRSSSPRGLLTPLQIDLLERFQAASESFFLTGGGALGEYYLGHRRSQDMDLFTADARAFQESDRILRAVVDELGASVRTLRSGPGFRRYIVERDDDQLVLDVVHDAVPQIDGQKNAFGSILVDTLGEIAVNKICSLLSRTETKDLVDLFFIDREGLDPLDLLEQAKAKDSGLTPASLAYTISQVPIRPLPEGMVAELTGDELSDFRNRLVERLTALAFPEGGGK
jgi:predicted nucleotidyltransferase component of viral defense system